MSRRRESASMWWSRTTTPRSRREVRHRADAVEIVPAAPISSTLQPPGRSMRLVRVDVVDDDAGALGGDQPADVCAEIARSPGDNRYPSFEQSHGLGRPPSGYRGSIAIGTASALKLPGIHS